ncbi:hypothetical protein F5Y10DRAFT_212682 [Nemania abortiva]|nr:hypothetical protein F5Y10DRAFT_212682 [Nemania abortiva]
MTGRVEACCLWFLPRVQHVLAISLVAWLCRLSAFTELVISRTNSSRTLGSTISTICTYPRPNDPFRALHTRSPAGDSIIIYLVIWTMLACFTTYIRYKAVEQANRSMDLESVSSVYYATVPTYLPT